MFNVRARGYEPRCCGLLDTEALKFAVEGAVEHRLKEIVQAEAAGDLFGSIARILATQAARRLLAVQ